VTSKAALSPRIFLGILALLTALALRVGRKYRPLPSDDDFAYIPTVWAAVDPALYPRDTLVQEYQVLLHAPLWKVLVVTAESTLGLTLGFWVVTILLTIASVLAMARLLRLTGAPGYFLPVAAVLAYGASVGLGRGEYEGALGNGVHIQWITLCLLLWCYDALARGRHVAAGVLLGIAFLSHPQVALHGAFVVAVATLAHPRSAVRAIGLTAGIAAVVGAPTIVPVALSVVQSSTTAAWSDADLIRRAYLFRLPGEYTFEHTSLRDGLLIVTLGLAGVAGALILRRLQWPRSTRVLVGLFTGHAVLLLATVIHMGGLGPDSWRETWLAPYLLGLSRTTPLFGVLGCTIAVAAFERCLDRGPVRTWARTISQVTGGSEATRLSWHIRWLLVATLIAIIGLSLVASRNLAHVGKLVYLIPVVLGVFAWRRSRRGRPLTTLSTVAGVVALACLAWLMAHDRKAAPVPPQQDGLFEWVQRSTPGAALFIVPPGMEKFRYYARRSIYVDLKLFSPAVPRAAPVWRTRLEEVADPDAATLQQRGWPGLRVHWDRSYAARNTPARIAWLLRRTGADYFVRDVEVRGAAPISQDALSRAQLLSAYGNGRYEVYRLAVP